MKLIKFKKLNKGYGILELVFYIAIFAVMSLLVINSILTMVSSFKETKANNNLIQSSKILEKISREIRNSESIHTISASSLKLNNQDSEGDPRTSTFTLSGDDLSFYENDILIDTLNPANISVTSLTFTNIVFVRNGSTYVAQDVVPLNSDAVKVAITLEVDTFGVVKSKTFYTTVVLRESY
jgi:Tfp pilus assembly protein PilE